MARNPNAVSLIPDYTDWICSGSKDRGIVYDCFSMILLLRILNRIVFVVVYLIILSIFAELLLRSFVFHQPKYYVYPPFLKQVFHPDPDILPGIVGSATYQTNGDGIRGDPIRKDHTYKILAIGGSTTESVYVDQGKSWPYLLQTTLGKSGYPGNVWVGNAGKSGLNTRHHVLAVKTLIPQISPDAIILLTGINDLNLRLLQDTSYTPMSVSEEVNDPELYSQAFVRYPMGASLWDSLKNTALYGMYIKLKYYTHFIKNEDLIDDTGHFYLRMRRMRREATVVREVLPDMGAALDEYRNNLLEIIRIAKSTNTRLIFMTQPTMFYRDMPHELESLLWFGQVENGRDDMSEYYSSGAMSDGIGLYNELMKSLCTVQSVECIDLASLLRKDTTVFYDDCHFNDSGSATIASILTNYFMEHQKAYSGK